MILKLNKIGYIFLIYFIANAHIEQSKDAASGNPLQAFKPDVSDSQSLCLQGRQTQYR
jgi:hypothetical protein